VAASSNCSPTSRIPQRLLANVQDILENFKFRNQLRTLSKADAIGTLINKVLDTEMKPRATEIQGMQTRLQAIADDIKKMQSNPAVPVNATALSAKQSEGEKLQRDIEYKQKDGQAAFAKRREELLGPIFDQVGKALDEFAKQKGYSVIIDISNLGAENRPTPILLLEPSVNITKDFITYFNSRPATTATTVAPK